MSRWSPQRYCSVEMTLAMVAAAATTRGELTGRGGGEGLLPGGYPFCRGGRAGLVQVGDIQGHGAEHIAEQQVGCARGVGRGEAGVAEKLEEPFT